MFPLAFILASTSSKIAIGVFLKIAQLYREAAVTRTHQTNEKGQWMPCHADHKKQTKKKAYSRARQEVVNLRIGAAAERQTAALIRLCGAPFMGRPEYAANE